MSKTRITRREFFKDAGLLVGGAAAASALPVQVVMAEGETPWLPAKWDLEADIVIAGYGSTGMPAAIEAYDAGVKDILIIEKAAWLGGQGRRCGGGILQAETVVQKALGVVDPGKEELYKYCVACGEGFVDPALLESFAQNDNVDWVIEKLGGQPVSEWKFSTDANGNPIPIVPDDTQDKDVPLSGRYGLDYSATPVFFSKYGFKPVMRCHWFTGDPAAMDFTKTHAGYAVQEGPNGGTGVYKTLNAAIEARQGIRGMASTTLAGLIATPEREVLGIVATNADGNKLYIKAKRAVLLGTGGWAGNKAMVQNYLLIPEKEYEMGKNPWSQAVEVEEDGAGILLAQAIGADTVCMGAGGGGPTTPQKLGAGGLKINTQSQVIGIDGKVMPRLYAGGRTAGGVQFKQYPSCGFAFSTAIWQGRQAGKDIAKLSRWDEPVA